ncbi:MAG: hypothetical protein WC613_03390 [Candidatus Aenigmatarchaeota archaeon]
MTKKSIDFVYMGGSCPSDGRQEYFFDHKSSFDSDYARDAFLRARQTIDRYMSIWTYIPESSPLRTQDETSDFVARMQELVPDARDVLTIFSCKHGTILYQRAVRFTDVEDTDDLARKIKSVLPIDLEKEKHRTIQSYFMEVK